MKNRISLSKIAGLISLLVIAITANAYSQMGMQEAIDIALKNNNSIKAARKSLSAKQEKVSSAWGNYAPTLSLEASYTHINEELKIDLNPIRTAMIQLHTKGFLNSANLENAMKTGKPFTPEQAAFAQKMIEAELQSKLPSFESKVKDQNFPSGKLTLVQPIFTGGKVLAGINAAKALEEVEKAKLSNQENKTINEVVNSYLTVQLAVENVKVRQEVYEGILKHQQRAERVYKEGVITNNDKLRADVALSEAERNLKEAEDKLNLARIALASILDVDLAKVSDLSDKLEYKDVSISIDACIEEAKLNNTNLLQLRSSLKALKQKLNAKEAEYYPTVYGFGFYNLFKNYLSLIDPEWGVGVGLKYEIFSGLKTKNEADATSAEIEALEFTMKDIERKIELLVRSQYLNMNLSKDSYKKLDKTKEQARENLRLNTKRFEEGIGTSFDVLDSQLALEGVMLKSIAYLNEYYQNLSNLYLTTGASSRYLELINR